MPAKKLSRILQIRRALSNGVFTTPKTAKSGRGIKLTEAAVQSLGEHLERQLKEIDAGSSLYEGQGLVFATDRGMPRTASI